MRPALLRFTPICLLSLACSAPALLATPTVPAPPSPTATATSTATATPTPRPTPTATLQPANPFVTDVLVHPDGGLYSGDVVSFEVIAPNPPAATLGHPPVSIHLGAADGPLIATSDFGQAGIGERWQATFTWAWDTTGLTGPQTLVFTLDPRNIVSDGDPIQATAIYTVTLDLAPADALPAPEPGAHWATSISPCCLFHYLTGTAAERDIQAIETVADEEIADVEARLGTRLNAKLAFNLISRVLGHGGFASDEITISYLDRDYAAGQLRQVFRHEATHILDGEISRLKPTLLTEGFAVYMAGGHFKPEPLEPRARALLALDRYMPLRDLADSFYPSQHEIGYLEGAAFVAYLIDTYGWEKFLEFYDSFEQARSQALMLETGLQATYDQSLDQIEADWLAHLQAIPEDPRWTADVRDTVAFYDTVRRYQLAYDPSAYFLNVWTPDIKAARERDLVADYLRHPSAPESLALETMLVGADDAFRAQDFARAQELLAGVNTVLDAHDRGEPNPLAASPLAEEYLAIVRAVEAGGYQPQHITLAGTSATVVAVHDWPTLTKLNFARVGEAWQLLAR